MSGRQLRHWQAGGFSHQSLTLEQKPIDLQFAKDLLGDGAIATRRVPARRLVLASAAITPTQVHRQHDILAVDSGEREVVRLDVLLERLSRIDATARHWALRSAAR